MTSQKLSNALTNVLKETINKSLTALKPFETDISPEWNLDGEIKAVIFDIYGTLLISGSGDIGISQEKQNLFPTYDILKKNGCQLNFPDDNDYRIKDLLIQEIQNSHREMKEQGIKYPEVDIITIWDLVIKTLIEDDLIHCDPDFDTVAKIALDYELLVNPVWPMPGSLETLSYLKENDMIMGIVSNAQFYTPITLETLLEKGISDLGFNNQYCYWSFAHKIAKPSSSLFNQLIEDMNRQMDIKSNEILYVGNDMLNDIYAAQKSGLKTALFAGDKRSLRLRQNNEDCRKIKPDIILTELSQLKKIIPQDHKEQ